jgi:N4-gp56 family major capsid protein
MADLIQSAVTATDGSHHYLGDPAQQKFFVLTLTRRAVPYLVLFEDAQFTHLPKNSGGFSASLGAISFRKINALWDPATDGVGAPTALVEGVPPASKDLSMVEVLTSLKQYGDWIKVSDLAEDTTVDGILVHAAEVLGEYEGQKLHRVALYAIDATTNVWYGDGTVVSEITVTASMKLSAPTLRRMVRGAKRANMARFDGGLYHMIIDPYQTLDLQEDAEFKDIAKYTGGISAEGGYNMLTGEVGKGWGIRFKEANEVLRGVGATAAVTYHSTMYGPNGFGMLDLATQAVKRIDPKTNRGISIFSQPVNRPDKLDPLGQLGFVSCKLAFGCVVFDPVQVMKTITAAST